MIDSEVVMEMTQINVSLFVLVSLSYCVSLSHILPHMSPTTLITLFQSFVLFCLFVCLFYQLSINANGVLAVLSDFMQGLQQTLQGVTMAGWHQVNQQLQGRKLILRLQS